MKEWIGLHAADLILAWGVGCAGFGLLTLTLTLRRRAVPAGLSSALLALAGAELFIIPNSFFFSPLLQMLRFVTVFFALDVVILAFILRKRRSWPAPAPEQVPEL
ncbi:hypothetical protein [Deinococcus fonticola]|uniref:hypothetical protein n=1 Tax=Deinococcus fonticola TaxID=2528713 RepID=UPI001074D5D7|nr:hypothetical protein [Deinococcus fonticola]